MRRYYSLYIDDDQLKQVKLAAALVGKSGNAFMTDAIIKETEKVLLEKNLPPSTKEGNWI